MIANEERAPYLFVSYAHKDCEIVLPLIRGLREKGFRVWYDEGIEVGAAWPKCIGNRLKECFCVVAFVSANYDDSENCWRELVFAQDLKKRIVAITMEGKHRFSPGMRMQLGYTQRMQFERYGGMEKILEVLSHSSVLKPCLGLGAVPIEKKKPAVPVKLKQPPVSDLMKNADEQFKSKNYKKALELYNKAAVSGDLKAQYMVGLIYDEGKGGIKSRKVAMGWYHVAAENGYAEAQNDLGVCFERGDNETAPDYVEAVKWYKKAAEQGYVMAQCNLAECYACGRGTQENKDEAIKWYQKAAAQGNIFAIRRLELLLRNTHLG